MAKKTARFQIGLSCEVCGKLNYIIEKNKLNTSGTLKLKKYCNKCRKHTSHKEQKKLD